MTRVRAAALCALGSLLLGVGLTGCRPAEGTDSSAAPCSTATMDPAFPIDTARDWVTYADHLVIVHFVSDQELQRIPDDGDPDQGEITRSVTVDVDDVLWSRQHAPKLPDELTYVGWGWRYYGDDKTELTPWGFPRVEAGHTYVMPVVRLAGGKHRRWVPFADSGVLPYDDGVLGTGETTPCAHPEWASVARRVIGQDAQALAATLERAKPDPRAAPFMDLYPHERWEHASRHR